MVPCAALSVKARSEASSDDLVKRNVSERDSSEKFPRRPQPLMGCPLRRTEPLDERVEALLVIVEPIGVRAVRRQIVRRELQATVFGFERRVLLEQRAAFLLEIVCEAHVQSVAVLSRIV